jgi:outer membrane translocation and assembly module TamA
LSPRGEQDADVVIGGDAMLNVTAEVRQGVWGPVTLAAFCDAGNVWVSRTRVRPFDVYPSAGGGIQFLTPVGPLRLDLATQLRLSGQPHSIQILSVSFGTPF